MQPGKTPAQDFCSGPPLTSQPLNTARWKASNCKGITLRMPCKQSTEWGTLIVLFVFLMVSVSSLSQITTGRPWGEKKPHIQPLVSKGRGVASECANFALYMSNVASLTQVYLNSQSYVVSLIDLTVKEAEALWEQFV